MNKRKLPSFLTYQVIDSFLWLKPNTWPCTFPVITLLNIDTQIPFSYLNTFMLTSIWPPQISPRDGETSLKIAIEIRQDEENT